MARKDRDKEAGTTEAVEAVETVEVPETPETSTPETPAASGSRDGTVTTSKDAEALDKYRSTRNDLISARTTAEAGRDDLRELGAGDDHRLVIAAESDIAAITVKIEGVDKSIAGIQAMIATAAIVAPLIDAIGEIEVSSAANLTATLPLATVNDALTTARAAWDRAKDQIALCEAIQLAVGTLGEGDNAIAPDVLAGLRPLKAVAVPGSDGLRVRVEVASTATRTGGTRAPTPNETITGLDASKLDAWADAEAAAACVVGQRVRGKGATFPSWTKTAEALSKAGAIAPEVWTRLTTTEENGKRQLSWRNELRDRFGVVTAPYVEPVEPVDASASATVDAPESEENASG